ncbi:MAG TPA: hypothetical protein PKG77_21910 [Phycisphaerae bacterium]|nr:hypothetical protein [Phycisphaerae bacterium]HQL75444.1 hypothetical protein [Phycisphaerae bacterium]
MASFRHTVAALSLLALACLPLTAATTYYFDVNGSDAGFGSPSGTYSATAANWNY